MLMDFGSYIKEFYWWRNVRASEEENKQNIFVHTLIFLSFILFYYKLGIVGLCE